MPCDKIPVPGGIAIICTRGRGMKRCHYCNHVAPFLCDHPVIRQGKRGTCDTPLCEQCLNSAAKNTDLCRPHFNLWRNNGNKLKLGDVEVKA